VRSEVSAVFLAAMPAMMMIVWQARADLALVFSLLALLSLGGARLILRQVICERATKCQDRLNARYQGRPACAFLLKESTSATRRLRYREAIAQLAALRGLPFPSPSEDRHDPASLAHKYAATLGHIEATSNFSKKPHLLAARVEFEFFLNCLALRWIGLTVAMGALFSQATVSLVFHPYPQVALAVLPHPGSLHLWLVPAAMIPAWLFYFTPGRARAAQEHYDRLLLISMVCLWRNRSRMRLGQNESHGVGSKRSKKNQTGASVPR
jgi:hypothetical protein